VNHLHQGYEPALPRRERPTANNTTEPSPSSVPRLLPLAPSGLGTSAATLFTAGAPHPAAAPATPGATTSRQPATMPVVYMPIPRTGPSPAMSAVEHDGLDWADSHGLLPTEAVRRHVLQARSHLCIALYYPHADAAHLKQPNRYMIWAFLVDDLFDDAQGTRRPAVTEAMIDDIIDAIRGKRPPARPAATAGADVLDALCQGKPPAWRGLLLDANERWLETYRTENRLTAQGRPMDLCDYLPHRRWSTDQVLCDHLTEYVHDIDLPARMRELPAMNNARNRAAEWVGLYNDLASFEKEEALGYHYNAVHIVREQIRCSDQQAIDMVNDMMTQLLHEFEAACASVPLQVRAATRDPEITSRTLRILHSYVELLRGNYDLCIEAPRYTGLADSSRMG